MKLTKFISIALVAIITTFNLTPVKSASAQINTKDFKTVIIELTYNSKNPEIIEVDVPTETYDLMMNNEVSDKEARNIYPVTRRYKDGNLNVSNIYKTNIYLDKDGVKKWRDGLTTNYRNGIALYAFGLVNWNKVATKYIASTMAGPLGTAATVAGQVVGAVDLIIGIAKSNLDKKLADAAGATRSKGAKLECTQNPSGYPHFSINISAWK